MSTNATDYLTRSGARKQWIMFTKFEEGCLSIPDYYEEVERPTEVKVKFLDLSGKKHEIDAKGLLATCLQHEIDHINGVLFIDHLPAVRELFRRCLLAMGRSPGTERRSQGAGDFIHVPPYVPHQSDGVGMLRRGAANNISSRSARVPWRSSG